MDPRPRCLPGGGLLPPAAVGALLLGVLAAPPGGAAPGSEDRRPYADGPPPGFTGGFGEATCRECHFDNPPVGREEAGGLTVRGFPDRFRAESTYTLRVELSRARMGRAGFQLAVRYGAGAVRGLSAGELSAPSARARTVEGDSGRVEYAQHTGDGSELPTAPADSTAWTLRWRAPARCAAVVLHVTANAANGDESEFGDHVYRRRRAARPDCDGVEPGSRSGSWR